MKLNLIQNINVSKSPNTLLSNYQANPSFCANNNNLERQPQDDKLETKTNAKSNIKKFSFGALVAVTLTGIVSFFAIRKIKKVKELENAALEAANKAKKAAEEQKARIEQQVREYFQAEEKELALSKQKIVESDARNEQWLEKQHNKKEKEYSDFWNESLSKKEEYEAKFNDIILDREISEDCFGNHVNLDWHLQKFKQSQVTKNTLEECENLTFDTPNLKLIKDKYDEINVYDLGLRYAIVANNTAKAKGSAVIINEIPEIFKKVNKDELIKILDELPSYLEYRKINKFTISGEDFKAEKIGGGCLSDVFKITDSYGNQICYKYARNPYLMNSGQGVFNEIAIMQEAQKVGVTDIPKLYMANPLGCIAQNPDINGTTTKGAWEIIELVDETRRVPQNGLKFLKWLETKGLYHGDMHSGNYIGDTIVDLGGICDRAGTVNKVLGEGKDISWLFRAYHEGKSTTEIIEKLKQYS